MAALKFPDWATNPSLIAKTDLKESPCRYEVENMAVLVVHFGSEHSLVTVRSQKMTFSDRLAVYGMQTYN